MKKAEAATKKKSEARAKPKTKATPVFLDEEQREWLRQQPSGISGKVRALVFEAMNLDNLAKSVKRSKSKPKSRK
jgi:hypothetical protein